MIISALLIGGGILCLSYAQHVDEQNGNEDKELNEYMKNPPVSGIAYAIFRGFLGG